MQQIEAAADQAEEVGDEAESPVGVSEQNDEVIEDISFQTFGCGAAIATSSMATELIKGKTVEEALKLTNKAVIEALDGLPPQKIHCSVLAEEAVKEAIANYYDKKGIEHDLRKGCAGHCATCTKHH